MNNKTVVFRQAEVEFRPTTSPIKLYNERHKNSLKQ